MKQKKSIFSYFQAVSLMMPFVFAVVSSFLSYREIYTRFDKNVNEIQTTQMAAKKAFLTEYGNFDESEKLVDDVVDPLYSLYVACRRESFPNWANDLLERLKDDTLLTAVEKLLEETA